MPAVGNHILDKGYDASAAITKFRAVKLHASLPETVSPISNVTDVVFGVAQNEVTTTELAKKKGVDVRSRGRTEMEAGAAIANIGTPLGVDNVGRCIPLVAGSYQVGVAEQAASGAGVRITVDLDAVKSIKA